MFDLKDIVVYAGLKNFLRDEITNSHAYEDAILLIVIGDRFQTQWPFFLTKFR